MRRFGGIEGGPWGKDKADIEVESRWLKECRNVAMSK